jgi:uridylate kinase
MKAILLKISGEALSHNQSNIAAQKLELVVNTIKMLTANNIKVALVIGGGNISRGMIMSDQIGIDRVQADHMSMIATVINAIAISNFAKNHGINSSLFSAFAVGDFVKPYNQQQATQDLHNNKLVIFAGGTGNPFFSTDSCAALRGLEMGVNLVVKATNIDGVYNKDPKKYPDAKKYVSVTLSEVIAKQIAVMDQTAFALCRENRLPIFIYNINYPNILLDFLKNPNNNHGSFVTLD